MKLITFIALFGLLTSEETKAIKIEATGESASESEASAGYEIKVEAMNMCKERSKGWCRYAQHADENGKKEKWGKSPELIRDFCQQ